MCLLCASLEETAHWSDPGPRSGPRTVERARRRRLVVAVAEHHGLRFREDPATRRATVADRKGRTELVGGLGELWPAIERLSGRVPDPLCPDLLAALSAAGGADS